MKKTLLFMVLVFALVLAACNSETPSETDSTGDSDVDAKKLIVQVGTSPTYPPFESEDKGELVGFDIALIKKIAEVEDFEVQFSSMQFDGLVPALKSGQLDVVVGALSITDKRIRSVNFSNAYYESGLSILTKPDMGESTGRRLVEQLADEKRVAARHLEAGAYEPILWLAGQAGGHERARRRPGSVATERSTSTAGSPTSVAASGVSAGSSGRVARMSASGCPSSRRAMNASARADGASHHCRSSTTSASGASAARLEASQYRPCCHA